MHHYTYTTEETLEAFRSAYPKLNIQTEDVEKIIQQWVMNNPGKLIERGMLPDECKQFIDARFEHLQGVFEWAVLRVIWRTRTLIAGLRLCGASSRFQNRLWLRCIRLQRRRKPTAMRKFSR